MHGARILNSQLQKASFKQCNIRECASILGIIFDPHGRWLKNVELPRQFIYYLYKVWATISSDFSLP